MSTLLPFVVIGLVSGSVYALAALGLVLTYKTSGIFNFAQGTVAATVAYAFYELRERQGLPWPVALAVSVLAIAPIIGLALERLARHLSGAAVTTTIVATLGLLVGVQQLVVIQYGAHALPFEPFLPTRRLEIGSVNVELGQLMVMAMALVAAVGLSLFFRSSRLGRAMRGVVDDPGLLSLTGTSPTTVRRWAWMMGSSFAGLSGILFAPTIGLDVTVLTLLVVQAFGAAAVGLFTSLSMTYLGALGIGVAAALSTKYVGDIPWMSGVPASLPFLVLFAVLVAVPRRRLVQLTVERPRRAVSHRTTSTAARRAGIAAGIAALAVVPVFAGTRLVTFIAALVYVIVFLSLALLERTAGLVSLGHLGFAAVGAAAFSHFAHGAGIPWLVAVLLSALVTVPVGAVVAIPAIRLSGLYLALATFGFGVLLERLGFGTAPMFGGGDAVPTPRPSFARTDEAYYYLVAAFMFAAVALIMALHHSRLGRLLRAMSDSPVALSTFGTNVTVIKLAVFCISAFLAGLAGALLGPVVGQAAPVAFGTFPSLLLVVVLALQGPVGEYRAAIGGAVALTVVPSYLTSGAARDWLPVVFGVGAVVVALIDARTDPRPLVDRLAERARPRVARSPVRARLAEART